MKTYVGIFTELLTEFVAFKRSLDLNYTTTADELYRFSKFSTTFNTTDLSLTKEMVQAWNTNAPIKDTGTIHVGFIRFDNSHST